MFRISAYYGSLLVQTVIVAEDIQAAHIAGELAYYEAELLVTEPV